MINKDQKPIVSAIIVAGVLIAGAILLRGSKPPVKITDNLPTGTVVSGTPRAVSSDDHIIGNPDAKVVVVEYSDLECPFCKSFHETMHQAVANNDGDVAWVFRHYPIPQLHQKAFREAEATECAWEQGGDAAFWRYTDKIFEITPSNDGLEESELQEIAKGMELDMETFNICLSNGKFAEKIQADINDGGQAGVDGTPSSFIFTNGKLVDTIPGALPYSAVKQKIDAALK
jgi:protein-disulfide isomerase